MDRYVVKGKESIDNRFVVPYCRDLLLRFQCHINLEVCNSSMSLKYFFKYCLKGHDNATMLLRSKKEECTSTSKETIKPVNEVKHYLDGRYVCASEAAWRILGSIFTIAVPQLNAYLFMFLEVKMSLLMSKLIFRKLLNKQRT